MASSSNGSVSTLRVSEESEMKPEVCTCSTAFQPIMEATLPDMDWADTDIPAMDSPTRADLQDLIPILEGRGNFKFWEDILILNLKTYGLDVFLTNNVVIAPNAYETEKNHLRAARQATLACIVNSLEQRIWYGLTHRGWKCADMNPHETFVAIKNMMTEPVNHQVNLELSDFTKLELGDFEGDVVGYYDKVVYYSESLARQTNMDDNMFMVVVIDGLRDLRPEWYKLLTRRLRKGQLTKNDLLTFLSDYVNEHY